MRSHCHRIAAAFRQVAGLLLVLACVLLSTQCVAFNTVCRRMQAKGWSLGGVVVSGRPVPAAGRCRVQCWRGAHDKQEPEADGSGIART